MLPWLCVALYVALLLYRLVHLHWPSMLRTVLVPLSALMVASALRAFLNRPRPYDVDPHIEPLLAHHSGRSFPSRHCVSASVISAVFWYCHPVLGALTALLALLVALSRVLCGVHFLKDVLVGLLFGFGWGAAFLLLF